MTAYLILGASGLLVLAISLLAGDFLEGFWDAALQGVGVPGGEFFSTEVASAFISALGFGGAIAISAGAPGPVAAIVGVAVGTAFAWMAAKFTRLVRGAGTDEAPAAADVVGQEAEVISGIPDDGFGTIRVYVGGHTLRFNASCDLALDSGARVHVTSVLSPTAVTVAPVWSGLPPDQP